MNLKTQNYNNLPMEQMIHDIESEDKRLLELKQSVTYVVKVLLQ